MYSSLRFDVESASIPARVGWSSSAAEDLVVRVVHAERFCRRLGVEVALSAAGRDIGRQPSRGRVRDQSSFAIPLEGQMLIPGSTRKTTPSPGLPFLTILPAGALINREQYDQRSVPSVCHSGVMLGPERNFLVFRVTHLSGGLKLGGCL